VFGNPNLVAPLIDRPAYVLCILEALHEALRRRDVYAVGADKWGDPRARLIEERLWVRERATVLTALALPASPRAHLAEVLDDAYQQVAAGLAANPAVRISSGKLHISRLEAAPEPDGFAAVRDAVAGLLPRIDYPELLLEVHARTGMFDAVRHISGSHVLRENLDITLAALTVARSCNIGLVPVIKTGDPALTEHRLLGTEKGFRFRDSTRCRPRPGGAHHQVPARLRHHRRAGYAVAWLARALSGGGTGLGWPARIYPENFWRRCRVRACSFEA
jgi:hypothetical protein